MNRDSLEQILPTGYSIKDFNSQNQIAKIEQSFADILVSKYVIDLNSDFNDINIKDYQEKFISKDYFDADGNIQWNYYLIFVRENFDGGTKREIEKDESYARKFVLNEEELKDYLDYQQSEVEQDEDVVAKWKQQLSAIGLQEVFSNEKYNQAIPRFVEGRAKKIDDLNSADSKPNESEDFVLTKVKNISLQDSYRDFPEKRNFNLGRVNLITGPNGVGKTSLMEGIELVITGNNSRNLLASNQNGCVEADYYSDGETISDAYTNTLAKYKARDYFWYSNPVGRFNEVYRSFNRYNFYNSDSAYQLSNNPNSEELTKYLTAIALGTEFGSIRNRLLGFQDRLDKERKRISSIIAKEEETKANSESQILKLKEISNPDVLFNQFIKEAQSIKWQKSLPQDPKVKTELFEEDYKTLLSYLNSLVHSKVVSEADASRKLDLLEKLKKNLEENENKKSESKEELKEFESRLTELRSQKDLIDKALRYLENENSFRIRSLNKEIQQLEQDIKRFDAFDGNIKKLNLDKIENSLKTINQLTKDKEEVKKEKEIKRKELQGQLHTLKSTIDTLKSVIAEIRYYGKEFIDTKGDDIDACPLCETPHTKNQLLLKVEKIYNEEDETKKIEKYNKSLNNLDKNILDISNELKTLHDYRNSLKNILSDEELSKSLKDITTSLTERRAEIDILRTKVEELKTLEINLRAEGFSEEELYDLEKNIAKSFNELKFNRENKKSFEILQKELKAQIEESEVKIENKIKKINEFDAEIDKLIEGKYEQDDYSSKIAFDIKELRSLIELFDKIKEFIIIQPSDFIVEVRLSVERVYEKYKSFKSLLVKFEELNQANSLIEKADKQINQQSEKLERIISGLKVINQILTEDSREKILDHFFKKNEEEISEIFTRIHSPKEFTGLSIESGQINLQKGQLGKATPINEISTGQRSALALSIFLALNRKLKKGPNIIIFDDPVTYTDDLNILSFLDYLRTLIINESRQLVFATASKKIAGLFEKKFSFLDDEFKTFELSRTDY